MNIEINGVSFGNKGAAMMLSAIVGRLRASLPDSRFVVKPNIGPYEWRTRLGLHHKLGGRRGLLTAKLLPGKLRQSYGLVSVDEIDVILDASGFAYGDSWPASNLSAAARRFVRAERSGKKIVFLPQAFGPFEACGKRKDCEKILRSGGLIFARDPESYDHVRSLVREDGKVCYAPDFTNLLVPRENVDCDSGDVAIIPNSQMVRHGNESAEDAYCQFLALCIDVVRASGLTPFLLLHQLRGDVVFAKKLLALLGESAPALVTEDDPLTLKALIGNARLVIGSRYHALVSSLSQGVPTIGTSWSHKYRYLFDDYDWSRYSVDTGVTADELGVLVHSIAGPGKYESAHNHLLGKSKELKQATDQMWNRVEAYIRS
ncbi:MAG: polysaccharide pyruvyl transferase family protein [Verrucomicrobia bacterium]|jgi:polysaccharide pyruvyl transferase WcaK-like protein|nr:polysaccharide pyruvyl transferase family protein [Verrucomicrobiota bacterium]